MYRGGVVTIGNFDGVHRGHARIVRAAARWARAEGLPTVAFTFDPHPAALLRPKQAPPPLTWLERRSELLSRCGADMVIAFPTDAALLRLTDREFFRKIVVDRLAARGLVEGSNFRFGRDRAGTVESLRDLCDEAGLRLEVVEPFLHGGEPVSSTRIRNALARGCVDEAAAMLGRPHRFRGVVGRGAARGRELGFPSANLEQIEAALPADGVYAGRALVGGAAWPAAVNIGPNPTFGETARKVESCLLDFEGDLYGQPMEIELLARLRDVKKFGGAEELRKQLASDVQETREAVRRARPADQNPDFINK